MGAWIETACRISTSKLEICRTLCGCVDWNQHDYNARNDPKRRTLCSAWIETTTANDVKQQPTSPPCVGAWIETCRKWETKRVNEDGKFVYPLLNHWLLVIKVFCPLFFGGTLFLFSQPVRGRHRARFRWLRGPCSGQWIRAFAYGRRRCRPSRSWLRGSVP